jgi:hypothetical protein
MPTTHARVFIESESIFFLSFAHSLGSYSLLACLFVVGGCGGCGFWQRKEGQINFALRDAHTY